MPLPETRYERILLLARIAQVRRYSVDLDSATLVFVRVDHPGGFGEMVEHLANLSRRLVDAGFPMVSYGSPMQGRGTWLESEVTVDLGIAP